MKKERKRRKKGEEGGGKKLTFFATVSKGTEGSAERKQTNEVGKRR